MKRKIKFVILGLFLVGLCISFFVVSKDLQGNFFKVIKAPVISIKTLKKNYPILVHLDPEQVFRSQFYLTKFNNGQPFNQNDPITREQAAYIAAQVQSPLFSTGFTAAELSNCYDDTNGSYAERFICYTKRTGALQIANDHFFNPQRPLTRREAVILTDNFFSQFFYYGDNLEDLSYEDVTNNMDLYPMLRRINSKNLLTFAINTVQFEPGHPVTIKEFMEMLFRAKLVFIYEAEKYTIQLETKYRNSQKLCKTSALFETPQELPNEQINFAINERYAESHPNWQNEARQIIDSVNTLYSRTGKQFTVNSFLTYPNGIDRDLFGPEHPEYFISNEFLINTKGVTIFACISRDPEHTSEDCPGGSHYSSGSFSCGENCTENFGIVISTSTLPLNQADQDAALDNSSIIAHELGHHLGQIDLYDYMAFYTEATGLADQSPPWWKLCELIEYDDDIMCDNRDTMKLTELTKKIISFNKNLKYSYGSRIPSTLHFKAEKIRITVLGDNNQLVPNAAISIYNIVQREDGMGFEFSLLDQIKSDQNGVVVIDAPILSTYFPVYLIDIQKEGMRKQKIFSFIDAEKESIVNNRCIIDAQIKLN